MNLKQFTEIEKLSEARFCKKNARISTIKQQSAARNARVQQNIRGCIKDAKTKDFNHYWKKNCGIHKTISCDEQFMVKVVVCKWGWFVITRDHNGNMYVVHSSSSEEVRVVKHDKKLKLAFGTAWMAGHRTTLYVEKLNKNYVESLYDENIQTVQTLEDTVNKGMSKITKKFDDDSIDKRMKKRT